MSPHPHAPTQVAHGPNTHVPDGWCDGGGSRGAGGRCIRHAPAATPRAVGPLAVPVIEPAFQAALMLGGRAPLCHTAAAAVIDRIVHHATVLTTAGESYRLKAATRNQASRATQEVPRRGDHHNSRKGVLFCLPFPPVPVSRLGGCARRRSTPAPRVFVVRPGGVHPALGHRPGRPSPCQGMRKRTTNRQDPHAVYAAGPRPPRAQRTPPARCPVRHQSTESMIRSTWIALSLGITIQSEPSAT